MAIAQALSSMHELDMVVLVVMIMHEDGQDHAGWQEYIARQEHSTFIVNAMQPLRDGGFLDGAASRYCQTASTPGHPSSQSRPGDTPCNVNDNKRTNIFVKNRQVYEKFIPMQNRLNQANLQHVENEREEQLSDSVGADAAAKVKMPMLTRTPRLLGRYYLTQQCTFLIHIKLRCIHLNSLPTVPCAYVIHLPHRTVAPSLGAAPLAHAVCMAAPGGPNEPGDPGDDGDTRQDPHRDECNAAWRPNRDRGDRDYASHQNGDAISGRGLPGAIEHLQMASKKESPSGAPEGL
ncbi:hypothetical protein PENSPDRAFT_672005 [Peniophora sp. CONT]|nr:hypothetical protein PENSPDRAFT_672005 [Peniophora sp. CONT]